MELEEIKNAWLSVDERLKKQEMLNANLIKEMAYKKTSKSLNTLQRSEFMAFPIMLATIPLMVWAYGYFGGKFIMWDILTISSLIFLVAYLPFLVWKAHYLMKMDLDGNLKNNLQYINKFAIFVKKEKVAACFYIPVFTIIIFAMLTEITMFTVEKIGVEKGMKFLAPVIVFTVCVSICTILFTIWSYKKIYDKNIKAIRDNLAELKEMEE